MFTPQPNNPDPNVQPVPGIIATPQAPSEASAQATVAATAHAAVVAIKAERQSHYDKAVTDYNALLDSGIMASDKLPPPPTPPFIPVYDPPIGPDDFGGWVDSTQRMSPTPPLTVHTFNHGDPAPAKAPNTIDVGKHISGNWYSVGPLDTFSGDSLTPPQADGHIYQKYNAVVGAGWYLQVS